MTVLTTLTYMVCALVERVALKDMVRKGPLKEYAVLAVVTFLGMYLTNWYAPQAVCDVHPPLTHVLIHA
jgi:hypothetical protein